MIGFLFATEKEALPFYDLLGVPAGQLWGEGGLARPWAVVISGMGPQNARAATQKLLANRPVTLLVNAGICGAVVDGVGVGSLFQVDKVQDAAGETFVCQHDDCWCLPRANLSTSREPVYDLAKRAELAAFGQLVDMEGAAVAACCAAAEVPCALIKGVSDFASPGHRALLEHNLERVAYQIAHCLHRRFAKRGAGPAVRRGDVA